jgi:hypothetical protein
VVEAAAALCRDIHESFRFDAGFSDVSTPLHRVLAARRGIPLTLALIYIAGGMQSREESASRQKGNTT